MEVGIKEFRDNISKYLGNLPITLTKHGKPFAIIQKASDLKVATNISKETSELIDAVNRVAGKKYKYISYAGKYKEVE